MKHLGQLFFGVVLAGTVGVATGQTPGGAHPHGAPNKSQTSATTGTSGSPTDSPATTAYRQASNEMHGDMNFEYTNDADIDFMKGMIAHHEGAIAMANIGLEYGRDPVVRKLSNAIIATQANEIKSMRAWLASREQAPKQP